MIQNPYQPPSVAPVSALDPSSWDKLSLEGPPVEFSGAPTIGALTAHLKSVDHAGSIAFCGVGLFSLLMLLWGLATGLLLPVACGIVFLLSLVTSTVVYRRYRFTTAYPNWQQPIGGHVASAGIRLVRDGVTSDYRWDWFGGVAVSKRSVCLLPAMPEQAPLLLTEAMTATSDGWLRLQTLSRRRTRWSSEPEFGSRNTVFKVLQKEPTRQPFAPYPVEATRFHGPVLSADVGRRQRRSNTKTPSARSNLVRGVIGFAAIIGFGGVVQIAWFFGGAVAAAVAVIVVLAAAYWCGFIDLGWRDSNKTPGAADRLLYHADGFFDSSGITLDYSLCRTKMPWSAVIVSDRSDDQIVIRTPEVRRHTILKRQMVDDDDVWAELIRFLTGPSGSAAVNDAS